MVSKHSSKLVLQVIRAGRLLGLVVAFALAQAALTGSAAAQSKDANIQLDWIIQGTHAPYFVALEKGYFAEEGLSPTIDAGKGATNVAVNVASGAYDFGWVDLPNMIRFNAQNPGSRLIAVYVSFDETPLAVITVKSAGIRTPADLDGQKIAGGPGTAVHDTISILLKAAGAEDVKVDWVAVQPQLFGPMLRRGEVVGTGGFTNSNVPAALELGFTLDELHVLKYSDFGADMYGLALVTREQYAEENPEVVRGVVRALNRGTIDTVADPEAALKVMTARDPLMKPDIEKVRLEIALGLTNTPHVRKDGLSSVTPEKLQKTIDAVAEAYSIETPPAPEEVYTDKFLPPVEERMPPESSN